MSDPTFWLIIALLVMNVALLAAAAISPGFRAWHRAHYRWVAAFAVLTGVIVMLVSLRRIFGT